MSEDEVGILVAVAGVIMLVVWLLAMAGCTVMPEHLVVRDQAGNKLADANTQTGEIRLTWAGLHAITPKVVLPPSKK
jgi:hypothetical protein